jgi:hypothetical protein
VVLLVVTEWMAANTGACVGYFWIGEKYWATVFQGRNGSLLKNICLQMFFL